MRLIAILIATFICQQLTAQNTSLKIQNEDSYYYPSNLKFEVLDEKGNTVLDENDLQIENPIVLEGDYTINVYTTWADGKDTFEVSEKALIAYEVNDDMVSLDLEDSSSWKQGQPKVVNKSFEANNGEFDAIIEFENDIYFRFIDGEPKITQNGKTLELVGNYVAKTTEGYLKMSYNPKNKEYWYVFTDTYNKVIYK